MNGKGSSENDEKLNRQILRYLVEHPDAKDTVDGVIKWWLSEDLAGRGRKTVQEGLDMLVSKGWLTRRDVTSSEKIYGVMKDRLGEIKKFLRGK